MSYFNKISNGPKDAGDVEEFQEELLKQLKIMNLYLSVLTDETFTEEDIEE